MKQLVAFDLDGTPAKSKQPLGEGMGETLAVIATVIACSNSMLGSSFAGMEEHGVGRLRNLRLKRALTP